MLEDKYTTVNIRDYLLNAYSKGAGEQMLKEMLSGFSCPLNSNVEKFLKENSVDFTKKNQSVTYLVFSNGDAKIVGYFTLAIKPITINSTIISNTVKKKLLRVGEMADDLLELHLAAYLIAQIGKNYANDANMRIMGWELLALAISEIQKLQFKIGGVAVFLEAEKNEKLLDFYIRQNNFKEFGIREANLKRGDKDPLVQMLKVL